MKILHLLRAISITLILAKQKRDESLRSGREVFYGQATYIDCGR